MHQRCYDGVPRSGFPYQAHSTGSRVKKLCKQGNSLALVIDRAILQLLGITEQTPLEISTDGESLVVAPVRDKKRQQQFEKALASSNKRHAKALKRLAE